VSQPPYPILEYDADRQPVLDPQRLLKPREGMPERVVLCFFQEVIRSVCGDGGATVLHHMRSEIGPNPIYVLPVDGQPVAIVHPGVGAPLAAAYVEELIALGGRQFIACGGAGVIIPEVAVGHLVVPVSAVRDEGTSYHYLPPAREVAATPDAVAALEAVLAATGVEYLTGKTWTTDGVYRETPAKIARRKAEGCLTVEMEAAAFFAVAQFREVAFGQLLYCGDDVSGAEWDSRHWDRRTAGRKYSGSPWKPRCGSRPATVY
jgi:uridine phosphorylase